MTDLAVLEAVEGLLFDLDGVVYVGDRLIEGAAEAVRHVRSLGVPYRFTTNTTTRSRASLRAMLAGMGLPIEEREILSAPRAAVLHLRRRGRPRCHLILAEDTEQEFAEFPVVEEGAEAVVIGDIGDAWTYAVLDRAFRMILDGAEIVALHKGKYWERAGGLGLDIGAFVAGLEYATGRPATVIGKPSPDFFRLAVRDLGLEAGRVAMIGDDVDSDVGGAQAAGLKGVLVRTGKYREALVARSPVRPDAVLDSVADLLRLRGGRGA